MMSRTVLYLAYLNCVVTMLMNIIYNTQHIGFDVRML